VTLNPNIAITIRVQFDPAATGAASGKLTFTSNSSSGTTRVVNLSGNGTAIQHQVTLSWSAPANSPMPVADYNVYRATGSSTSYQLLSSSNSTGYLDPNVQANTVYSYYVTSVGETGTESSPSNQVSVTVP
jgi:fibronectin type 3 domain-containing protein